MISSQTFLKDMVKIGIVDQEEFCYSYTFS